MDNRPLLSSFVCRAELPAAFMQTSLENGATEFLRKLDTEKLGLDERNRDEYGIDRTEQFPE